MLDIDSTSQAESGADASDQWRTILTLPAAFPADVFIDVMLNLVRNPNLTSSHLFRADILFDHQLHDGRSAKHLKEIYRPKPLSIAGWEHDRTMVRELIPRNTNLDKSLIQTCHFLHNDNETMVLYIPHAHNAEDVPYYHPKVAELFFKQGPASLNLSYRLFHGTELDDRMQRTGIRLLETVNKHAQGQMVGYEKRVHHDRIIPQKTFQDTYTRLKNKYARSLSENWVEVTDPGKHVFEDIAIAAFLIELWKTIEVRSFVDIGCGNGLLTYLLTMEGYKGYGFDARRRKTWSTFPSSVQLREQLLVPAILRGASSDFEPGVFIISNHADELTAWTPLLAYLNHGSFIAIPCCSHNLAGARFRAPNRQKEKLNHDQQQSAALPQQQEDSLSHTGSLKKTLAQKKMQSAYQSLCQYVEYLAAAVGYEVETEVLRIPSTRNHSIIGRRNTAGPTVDRQELVRKVLREELGDIGDVAREWQSRVEQLSRKPGSGH